MIKATPSSVLAVVLIVVFSCWTVEVCALNVQSTGMGNLNDQSTYFENMFNEDAGTYRSMSGNVVGKLRSKVSKRGHIELMPSFKDKALTTSSRVGCSFAIGFRSHFTPAVYGASCMCGRRGRGRLYTLQDSVKTCVSSCMATHHGSVCSAHDLHSGFENEFSACCSGCGGKRSILAVTSSLFTNFRGRFLGCIAQDNKPSGCEIEVDQLSSFAVPNIHNQCKCGTKSTGRSFVVCESMKICMDPCMSADEGQSCDQSTIVSSALSQFQTCCNTCDGHLLSSTLGSTTYTSCI